MEVKARGALNIWSQHTHNQDTMSSDIMLMVAPILHEYRSVS